MTTERFTTTGILHYSELEPGINYKLTAVVDPGVAEFYRHLVPKTRKCQPGRYAPHVTVVRNELPTNMEKWGLHEGKEVAVEYDNIPSMTALTGGLIAIQSFSNRSEKNLDL